MTTEIKVIHDRQNGVIKVKINGENACDPWIYRDENELIVKYLMEARQQAFIECCAHTVLSGKVQVTELTY